MRFSRTHYMLKHKTIYYLSDTLDLLEKCKTCNIAITVENFEKIKNLDLLICKARTDYHTECCTCTTVVECRDKHDCCCGNVLDHEREKKRLEKKEREATGLIKNDPELAEMICEQRKEKKKN